MRRYRRLSPAQSNALWDLDLIRPYGEAMPKTEAFLNKGALIALTVMSATFYGGAAAYSSAVVLLLPFGVEVWPVSEVGPDASPRSIAPRARSWAA
jgi:hypothetical protein